jgi:hypothetical protein
MVEMVELTFEEARAAEDEGEPLLCLNCGKPTSTYPRQSPASGEEQMYECMCAAPKYSQPKYF